MPGVLLRISVALGGPHCPWSWVGFGAMTLCDIIMWGRGALEDDLMTLWV